MDNLINVSNIPEDISDDEPLEVVSDDDLINVHNVQEDVSEDEEILEQEQVQQPEPLIIETKGKWQPFEAMANTQFVKGQTYNIKVQGKCEFMISKDRPTFGIQTNEFQYTKDNVNRLWIKTGG